MLRRRLRRGFPPQVTFDVGLGLAAKRNALGGLREGFDVARPGERAVREGEVIAFDDVVESKSGAVIAGDGEADGIGTAVIRKSVASSAGVAHIAEGP